MADQNIGTVYELVGHNKRQKAQYVLRVVDSGRIKTVNKDGLFSLIKYDSAEIKGISYEEPLPETFKEFKFTISDTYFDADYTVLADDELINKVCDDVNLGYHLGTFNYSFFSQGRFNMPLSKGFAKIGEAVESNPSILDSYEKGDKDRIEKLLGVYVPLAEKKKDLFEGMEQELVSAKQPSESEDDSAFTRLGRHLSPDQLTIIKKYYFWYSTRLFYGKDEDAPKHMATKGRKTAYLQAKESVLKDLGKGSKDSLWYYAGFLVMEHKATGFNIPLSSPMYEQEFRLGNAHCALGHNLRNVQVAWNIQKDALENEIVSLSQSAKYKDATPDEITNEAISHIITHSFFGNTLQLEDVDLLDTILSENAIVFGITCVSDFFNLTEEQTKMLNYVQNKSLTEIGILADYYDSGKDADINLTFKLMDDVIARVSKHAINSALMGGAPILSMDILHMYQEFRRLGVVPPKSLIAMIRDELTDYAYSFAHEVSDTFKNNLNIIMGKEYQKLMKDLTDKNCTFYGAQEYDWRKEEYDITDSVRVTLLGVLNVVFKKEMMGYYRDTAGGKGIYECKEFQYLTSNPSTYLQISGTQCVNNGRYEFARITMDGEPLTLSNTHYRRTYNSILNAGYTIEDTPFAEMKDVKYGRGGSGTQSVQSLMNLYNCLDKTLLDSMNFNLEDLENFVRFIAKIAQNSTTFRSLKIKKFNSETGQIEEIDNPYKNFTNALKVLPRETRESLLELKTYLEPLSNKRVYKELYKELSANGVEDVFKAIYEKVMNTSVDFTDYLTYYEEVANEELATFKAREEERRKEEEERQERLKRIAEAKAEIKTVTDERAVIMDEIEEGLRTKSLPKYANFWRDSCYLPHKEDDNLSAITDNIWNMILSLHNALYEQKDNPTLNDEELQAMRWVVSTQPKSLSQGVIAICTSILKSVCRPSSKQAYYMGNGIKAYKEHIGA